MDKISIITPSYNQGPFIPETIESVVNQKYVHKEYLVIDGQSNDSTVGTLNKYSRQIDYWESAVDNGQSHAINKGLKRCSGDIIGWINSDDYYEPNIFEFIAQSFYENPGFDLLYFDVRNFSPTKSKVYKHQTLYSPETFLTKVCLHQPGVFWRREIMEQVGYLNEKLHFVMDFEFWIRIYLNGKMKYIPKVVADFRIHDDSKTHNDPIELYDEKNHVITGLFSNLKEYRYLDELEKLNLTPMASSISIYPVSRLLPKKELDRIFFTHLLNNAFLSYRKGDYAHAETILNYMAKNKSHNTLKATLLKAKILKRKISTGF